MQETKETEEKNKDGITIQELTEKIRQMGSNGAVGRKNWRFYDSAFLYARNIDSTRFRRDADTASQRNGSRG